ncbi:sensor histidine kinase [Actinoplanes hulinensis]|uniref:histidine kinase n=1 Tax=Actinoplanes hulinensis TaxID=1144547 RepID=A0ABS7B3B5_9ACTN|nr:sensor histidine kinase [Actinoplanes hulinensis]MBW6435520.1 sensor histidine kinase [Actinoplanes hulinensis]
MLRDVVRRISRSDVALAAGFVVYALLEELLIRMPGDWWPSLLALCAVLILLRRQFPLTAMVPHGIVVMNVFYVEFTIDGEKTINFRLWQVVAMIICSYAVGRWAPPFGPDRRVTRRGLIGALLILYTVVAYYLNNPGDPMADIFFPGTPYVLGIVVANQARKLAEAAAVRAEFRERQAREAIMEERVRIARELHDMVAHSVTVMVIQAGVVRRRMDAELPVDPQLLRGIEEAGRDAVVELRRTLGLLRGEGGDGTAQAPAGLERLEDLVGQVRETGLRVTVQRDGDPVPLLPAVDLSAYRIVQEALTNVLKHAHASHAELTVDYRADGLHLGVVNDGPPAAPAAGGGQGLIGMRERVTLFGGDLTAGPRAGGGFAVTARLPVTAREARP